MKKAILIILLAVLGMTQLAAQEDGYLPLVREGVKWVNEKVIVDHGDTTCYYYNYEFRGYDTYTNLNGDINNACYYFTGESLDTDRDSLIAGLREDHNIYRRRVTFLRNDAYLKILNENRLMLPFPFYMFTDGGTTLLYIFGEQAGCDYFYVDLLEHLLEITEELHGDIENYDVFLTHDNFKRIDPIPIEGIECERYAYIGEYGDTLAYVVEGIGFDSRDLGDLLTPFSRKSDPADEYQEWCGLSHVVKDGKIIYKGMRYREGTHVGIDEVAADRAVRPVDGNYYNLMGQPVGTEVPSVPGIYIHQGKKIIVR